ncbi:hypothetical protein D3C75_887890 [compost metagenome]
MAAAAQFKTVVTHLNDTYHIAVLLSEEGHCPHRFGFFNRLALDHDIQAAPDLSIYAMLNITQLLRRNCAEMREVKTQTCAFY